MACQPGSTVTALPAAAHVVGNAFVNQYYNVLHQSPQVVHRFYTDESRLTRAEAGPDGVVDTVVSQSEIHQKVMALDYGDFKAEIITVDSQESLTGGVIVMVTGALSNKLSGKRKFTQSFFLAPQVKGYFVLNDIFRYLDDEPQMSTQAQSLVNGVSDSPGTHVLAESEPSHSIGPEVPELSPAPISEVEPTVEEVFEPSREVEVLVAEDLSGIDNLAVVETTPVIVEPLSPLAASPAPIASLEEISEETPKKSYASILRMKEISGSPVSSTMYSAPSRSAGVATDRTVPFLSDPTSAATGQDSLDEGAPAESEVDGRSVYVKNLPTSISSSQLEEEFGKFGLVKPGGINLKNQKQGACYAFVEFEETASAQTAVEVSPISIGGRQVYIEEKRPMGSRAGSRGSRLFGAGRGDRPFRSDGLRGRASFTGRGLGRVSGQDRDRDTSNRGRASGPLQTASGNLGPGPSANGGNSGGIAAVDNSRRDVQMGNGSRAAKRGGAFQQTIRQAAVSRGSPPVASS